jgi:hypothetical protein
MISLFYFLNLYDMGVRMKNLGFFIKVSIIIEAKKQSANKNHAFNMDFMIRY